MPATDLYIIPQQVQFIPIADIPEPSKNKFEYNEDDVVLTYANARQTSKIIDADFAVLLKEFIKPATMVEGIFKYSYLHQLNPQETLEKAYPFLSRLRSEGFLIKYDADMAKENQQLFQPTDVINDYTVVQNIQVLPDTEVYQVKKENRTYILKLLKASAHPASLLKQFNNEIAVLQKLEGKNIAPLLLEHGAYLDHQYMILEFCPGTSSDIAAEKFRNLSQTENVTALLSICVNILAAYEVLHQNQIVHSDIHPRNLIIADTGAVKIIDFGLSRWMDKRENTSYSRGGISFFYEPEYAQAILKAQPLPPATFAGEQYAIAALLYQLFTGKTYVDFSYEREVQLQQIVAEPPLPFITYDIILDPSIEKALFKALSKNPEDRYLTIQDMKEAFANILNRQQQQSITTIAPTLSYTAFCNHLKEQYGFDGPLLASGLHVPPTCSVNYGAAGIAYMLYRMAMLESDAPLLSLADVWINRALEYPANETTAFYSKDIDITPATVGNTSIYHSASGIYLVQAFISKAMGDIYSYNRAVQHFLQEIKHPCTAIDVTVGKASTVLGCTLLLEQIWHKDHDLYYAIRKEGTRQLGIIWNDIEKNELAIVDHSISYRGIAHGWAGLLYSTLKWCRAADVPLPPTFFDRVQQLIDLTIFESDYARWGITHTDASSWTGWCHGSAGYIFLWSLLYQHTQETTYLDLAIKAGRHMTQTEKNESNANLCCGLSGESYALLQLYRLTDDSAYLTTAKSNARAILQTIYSPLMRNHSLYKGDVGAAVYFTELEHPAYARMPLFE